MPSQPVDFQQPSMMDFVTLDEDYGEVSEADLRGNEDKKDKEEDDLGEHEVRRGPGQWRMVTLRASDKANTITQSFKPQKQHREK